MSSRHLFCGHVLLVGVSIVLGMSESYSWLAWAKTIAPVVTLLMPVNVAMPLAILVLARREQRSPERTFAAVMLSVVLSAAWFFAVLPLVM